jgi:peptidoglycan/xylan/chitin deacetylase (PgdA/CDA1 family)
MVGPAPAAAATVATAPTVVTIGFDDGTADQLGALPILQAHGMTATFFVNTGFIGNAEHLSWADLHTLFDAGNEIAGHTLHHTDLKPLTTAEARQEVYTDRNNLVGEGFPATSFAYPFGSFDSGTELVVRDCGYNSGRGVSGISKKGPYAESIPPLDPYSTRTPPNPKKATKLSTLQLYVQNAEASGGGWVQFVFHHLCEQCDAYAISSSKFTALLDFLQGEVAAGRVTVQTTAQVIDGTVQPPVPA